MPSTRLPHQTLVSNRNLMNECSNLGTRAWRRLYCLRLQCTHLYLFTKCRDRTPFWNTEASFLWQSRSVAATCTGPLGMTLGCGETPSGKSCQYGNGSQTKNRYFSKSLPRNVFPILLEVLPQTLHWGLLCVVRPRFMGTRRQSTAARPLALLPCPLVLALCASNSKPSPRGFGTAGPCTAIVQAGSGAARAHDTLLKLFTSWAGIAHLDSGRQLSSASAFASRSFFRQIKPVSRENFNRAFSWHRTPALSCRLL